MAVSVPNGAIVNMAKGYSAPVTIQAISNANPAVASATGHTFKQGDYVEITSGWSRLANKIVRVGAVTSGTFELEGYDTSLTSIYATGGGAGSARSITGWQQISQILSSSSSGGDQQFLEYQFLEADAQQRIPTFKNAAGLTLSVGDDPTLPGYQLASQANDDRLPRAAQIALPSGAKILYNNYVSFNKTPTLTVNELMACALTLSFLNEPVRYAS
ncbi:phage tail protein [Dyella caseinilytica]|uniref:Phage tail protein n=1 Tax=Dyella caseinilytica TaxID=1849581 RepID=A0ABX7GPQ0_9GAMM|nr:phage tail protein [Dyella caseinilytica]QRN52391.1 phage tail protein [Dyella caseinilytica]GGA05593.1 phage tail protein [Dyella caseinilytica]